jgi:hypothetical protein
MRNHLKHIHKSAYAEEETAPAQVKRQTSLLDYNRSKAALGKTRHDELTCALAWMCAVDLRPVSLVAVEGFRHYSELLNPCYAVPCRTTVTHHVQLLYNEGKKELMEDMKCSQVAMTTDLWTSVAQEGYITITVHYISPDWDLKCKVLATRVLEKRHTGVHIAAVIHTLREEIKIPAFTSMTTDNAANMVVAAEKANIPRIPCFSHTLQLAINDGLKKPQIQKALAACRRLVSVNYLT